MEHRKQSKRVVSPFSSGQGGARFENEVQTMFAALMLAKSEMRCLPGCAIEKIKLQVRVDGYQTDDMLVFFNKPNSQREHKMLVAIKHSVKFTMGDPQLGEVLRSAWVDYCNSDHFAKDVDLITLVTGPLNVSDVNHTREILEWAKTADNADRYMKMVMASNFSSKEKRDSLAAIRRHLAAASGTEQIDEGDLFTFLKHWHVIPSDLDVETSLNFSLLSALLGERSHGGPRELWDRMAAEMALLNQRSGTVTRDSLVERLRDIVKPVGKEIPSVYTSEQADAEQSVRVRSDYARHLALANFLGGWNENDNVEDSSVVEQLTGENYIRWALDLRRFLNFSDSPVRLRDRHWSINNRKELWKTHGKYLTDYDIEAFQKCAMQVLSQRDPAFDLSLDQRHAANLHGKAGPHSRNLRKGISEGLALLGSQPDALTNCSRQKREYTAALIVRELLSEAEPEIWGSLNDLLPELAEAAPDEFLDAVERGFRQDPCPFDFLFAQEGEALFGMNCHTGLLWALEILAWDSNYLIRACALLGRLASRDPGGKLSNRPANSLVAIFLPWFPQTTASFDKRKTALEILAREELDEAWQLLISLLPDQHQHSCGTRKPSWRDIIPSTWKAAVSTNDYWEQVTFCAQRAVSLTKNNPERVSELVQCLDKLPKKVFEEFLELLSSQAVIGLPEEKKRNIWESLTTFAEMHRKFSDADWALETKIVDKIESVSKMLRPQSVLYLHRNLFGRHDSDHYDRSGDYEEQAKNLEDRRQQAIREIFDGQSITGVLDFAKSVERPDRAGHSLGAIANAEADAEILPSLLDSDNQSLNQFVCGYVWRRREACGWEWLDGLDMSGWNPREIAHLLSCLPFTSKTWDAVSDCLGEADKEYWMMVPVYYLEETEHYKIAVDKLNMYGRYDAAVDCLCQTHREGHTLDASRIVQTLLGAASSEESARRLEVHEIAQLIKVLQEHPDSMTQDLMRVELAYLPLLDHYHEDSSPTTLERQLRERPEFFCETIQLAYRSEKERKSQQGRGEKDQDKVMRVWKLLHEWKIPPGLQPDGTFSFDDFEQWLAQVKEICIQSGHLEIALTHVGQVLFYCPADLDGAWINKQVAEILNEENAEAMREGFRIEAFTSRGAHWVDPTGAPELKFAREYRKKAEFLEREGLRRFAQTLVELSQIYEREAQRIVDEHNDENSQ